MNPPPAVAGIDHLNIVVRDLDRSLDFYCRLLGFREVLRTTLEGDWIGRIVGLEGVRAEVAFVVAPGGEPRIELLRYHHPGGEPVARNSQPNTPGLRHIALRVAELAPLMERLRAEGVAFFGEPVKVPGGAVHHEAGEKELVYFTDPDGVILELCQYR
ncbi:MAG: VOC family protein [Verrucomicrobiota bacterium]